MSDDELRDLLREYVKAEMDRFHPEQMEGYDHEFSIRYKLGIRWIFWKFKVRLWIRNVLGIRD